MPTVGRTLASERLRQDLDLDRIAAVTKIGSRSLKAIEADDFEQLPGRIFARNFVRQYAQCLKMDSDAMVAQFDREQSPPEPQFLTPKKAPGPRRSFAPSLNLNALADLFGNTTLASFLSFVVTIGLCAGGVWIFQHWGAVSSRFAWNRPVAASNKPMPKPAPVAPPVVPPVVPQVTNPAAAPPAAQAPVHVSIAASEPCWTRITVDGKVLFAGTLSAGETRDVDAVSVVSLRAGNAGAISLKLNGSDVPPIGPKGQSRSVTITSAGAQVVRTPTPEPVVSAPL